jgi:two-component system sensor histidine kinase QseC
MLVVRIARAGGTDIANAMQQMEVLRKHLDVELDIGSPNRTRVWQGSHLVYSSAGEVAVALPPAGSKLSHQGDWVDCVERDGAAGLTVQSSQQVLQGQLFATSGIGYLLTPLAVSLPFLLLPVWLVVVRGLRPLRAIATAIDGRAAAALDPLPEPPHGELRPLVQALNRLMRRLAARIQDEQQLLADAAHELKTPLAVMQVNAHLLLDGATDPARRQAHDGLRDGIARAAHTVHQLLAFERARGERSDEAIHLLDLVQLVRDRLAQAAPLALTRAIEIEFDAASEQLWPLHRESMAALLDNVIGNAIKYSPDGGIIAVRLAPGQDGLSLWVADQGPGIAPALRRRVFERFYRVPGQTVPGSGLGLAIAQRAAARNGATIGLEEADGGGLLLRVCFGVRA